MDDPEHDSSESEHPQDASKAKRELTPREPPIVPQVPPSPTERTSGCQYGHDNTPPWKKVIEILAFLVLLAYTVFSALQWLALRDTLKESQVQFKASERPYVGLGNHEGKIAEFVAQPDIRSNHWVVLHFFNSGHTPAFNFNARYWTTYNTVFPQPRWPQVQRFRDEVTGKIQVFGGGTTVPAESEYTFYVGPQGLPSKQQLERLRGTGEQFQVSGTFDYCDKFGEFHCEGYAVTYLGQFNSWILNTGPTCQPPLRETNNTVISPGRTTPDPLTPLCPCAKPGEKDDK